MGQKGFHGASVKVDEVDPQSLVTPWLITGWLAVVVRGLGQSHAVLRQLCDLDSVRTQEGAKGWQEAVSYFAAFGLEPKMEWRSLLMGLLWRYSRRTSQFLFGTSSQRRGSIHP